MWAEKEQTNRHPNTKKNMHTGVFGLESLFSFLLVAYLLCSHTFVPYLFRLFLSVGIVAHLCEEESCGRWAGRVGVVACIRGEKEKKEGKKEKE